MDNIIGDDSLDLPEQIPSARLRNAVILPDGSKPVALGSGTISGLLGVGGMANVYEIWNSQLEISRAVKLLHPNYTQDQKERFQTEIKICAKLHHPNIVEIHAVGAWNGLPYIEMELIRGYTLDRIIADRGALPLETITALGILIGRALQYAHNQKFVLYGREYHGIIHRDLKPSNIMIANDGTVKLMDFGIARPTDASIHTTDGAILGTMQYLAPEQLDGKDPDIRADIYSMGTILYEMVAGVKAFPEQNVSKLMLSKIRNDFRPIEHFEVNIPARLRKIIHTCLAQDREKRVRSSDALLIELTRIHHSLTSLSPEQVMIRLMQTRSGERTIIAERKRFPLVRILVGLAVLALLSMSVVYFLSPHRAPNRPQETVRPTEINSPAAPVQKPQPVTSSAGLKQRLLQNPAPSQIDIITASARTGKAGRTSATASPLDQLKDRYQTNDLMVVLKNEIEAGNYSSALSVLDNLPADLAATDKAKIYRMRVLARMGDTQKLAAFLSGTPSNDGEFHLARARMFYGQGDITNALACIDRSLAAPHPLIDDATFRQDALYYRALCRSRQFDSSPSQTTLTSALDAWFEIKSAMRTSQDHAYFKKAVGEMQRLHL